MAVSALTNGLPSPSPSPSPRSPSSARPKYIFKLCAGVPKNHGDGGASSMAAPPADGETGTQVGDLPEECLALAIALTSPRDACRAAAVSPAFRAAADSDAVWRRFLPDDLLAPGAANAGGGGGRKHAYLRLCDAANAAHVGGGGGCRVWVERASGGRCYAVPARALSLPWDDGELSWRWTPHPRSRFGEVAELVSCTALDIHGRLPAAAALTPATPYAAYLVYGTEEAHRGLSYPDQETAVAVGGGVVARHAVCLCPGDDTAARRRSGLVVARGGRRPRRPAERGDGWWEMEMGRLCLGGGVGGEEEEVVASFEVMGWHPKSGLIVEGIEFRPVG
ncbi:hypothetical protein ACP4OV_018384 [Aristida adscensionis]